MEKTKNILQVSKAWDFDEEQSITVYGKRYNIHAALMIARNIHVVELNIAEIYISYETPCRQTLRSFIEHIKHVNDADLSYPILMNEDGYIIDGRHRLAKAILEGHEKIKVKRFKKDPSAIYEWV